MLPGQMSFQQSLFPSAEKYGKIVPIFKSGGRDLFGNYRPVFSKIIERLFNRQLYSHLEDKNLLNPNQYVFRKGRCTSQAVTFLSDYICMQMDEGNYTGAVYVDLVDHSILLSKLPAYGICN